MKKFADRLYIYGIIAVILFCLNRVVDLFRGLGAIKIIGNGSVFIGLLKIPFCVWGIIQICRGLCAVLGNDFEVIHEKFNNDKHRGIALIVNVVATIAGCLFAFEVL